MQNIVIDRTQRNNCRKNLLNFLEQKGEVFCYHNDTFDILVSNFGRIKKSTTGKFLKSHKNKNGYECVNIRYSNGKRMSTLVHRLVADTFLKFFNNDNYIFEVNHIDGNKSNNNVNNLEWLTRGENLQHARDNKLFKSLKGEKSPRCKFTRQDCKDMIEFYRSGLKIKEIAELYKADRNTISNIVKGKARVNE